MPTTDSVAVRFAVLGDVEPKPDPVFDNFRKAVEAVNRLAENTRLDFTVCIGDLAHQGKEAQYEIVSEILAGLHTPVYAIMGNEELSESAERFLKFSARWNRGSDAIPAISYVKERAGVAFVFATAPCATNSLSG